MERITVTAVRRVARVALAALGGGVLVAGMPPSGIAVAQSPSLVPGLLGAATEVFRDDMSAPGTWEVISDESGVTAYDTEHGWLTMSVIEDRSNVWDDAELESAAPVIRVESWVATSGNGVAGVACGSALGLPRWLWAGIDGDTGWVFGRMIDGRLTTAVHGDLPIDVDGRRATVSIECAADPESGGDHVVVTVDGQVVHVALDIPVGPYDKGTIIVASDVAPVEAAFDDVAVAVGDVYVPPARGALPSPTP